MARPAGADSLKRRLPNGTGSGRVPIRTAPSPCPGRSCVQFMIKPPDEQILRLRAAIREHDFLHRIRRTIEQLLKVVFRADAADSLDVRAAAEEILMTDILTRHHGNIDGVYFSLRKAEEAGHNWEQAIADYAAYAHNYFTTPLGVVLRRDIFGDDCHFITPAAGRYLSAAQRSTQPSSDVDVR